MKELEKYFIDSKNVRRIKYYDVTSILEVQFLNGKIYHYFNVPEMVFESAMTAMSIGQFLQAHIKGHYTYQLIS